MVAFTSVSQQRGAGPQDDGVHGAAAAGAGSVRQLFCLRDCRRRIPHHRPGDFLHFNNVLARRVIVFLHLLPGSLTFSLRVFAKKKFVVHRRENQNDK